MGWSCVEGAPYIWPASNHDIEVAPNGDIWIGGNGEGDTHIVWYLLKTENICAPLVFLV